MDVVEAYVSRRKTQGQSCRLFQDVIEAYVSRRKTRGQSCRLFGCGRGICVKEEDSGAELQAVWMW